MAIEPSTLEAWVKGGAYISSYVGYGAKSSECSDAGLTSNVCEAINKYFKDGFVSEDEAKELEKLGINGITGNMPLQSFTERLDADLKDGKVINALAAADRLQFLYNCLKRIEKAGEPIDEKLVKSIFEKEIALFDILLEGKDLHDASYERIITSWIKTLSSFGSISQYAIPILLQLIGSTKRYDNYFASTAYYTLTDIMPSVSPEYADELLQDKDPSNQATVLYALGTLSCSDLLKIHADPVKNLADNSAAKHFLGLAYFCQNANAEETLPSQTPIACLGGETPFKMTTDCTEKSLLQAYEKSWQFYNTKCHGRHRYSHETECDKMEWNPPFWLRMIGTLGVKHPFFNIYLYMTPDSGFDDIRSGKIFEAAASSNQLRRLLAKQRTLTILYPASGAGLQPIVIPLKMIDEGRIDQAKLIYTEAGEGGIERLKLYLNWYERHGVITDLKIDTIESDGASETSFQFNYKGKPVTLLFMLNRTKNDFYADEEHMREADFVVIHDNLYEHNNNAVSRLLSKLKSFHDKPRLVLSEDWWGLEKKKGRLKLEDVNLPYATYEGPYGCTGYEFLTKRYVNPYRLVNGILVEDTRSCHCQDKDSTEKRGDFPAPATRITNIHANVPHKAVLIEVF
ncbi:MAG: hypothetical protein HYY43_06165 [Deltaproteobacteria bacterium]|nr:hypothetical protein [Deltaproteobacteria bacterium]MBI2975155.1 hypothetical protein [Deltaproteobacteria bacterium]